MIRNQRRALGIGKDFQDISLPFINEDAVLPVLVANTAQISEYALHILFVNYGAGVNNTGSRHSLAARNWIMTHGENASSLGMPATAKLTFSLRADVNSKKI
jgi:hypothetical protein